MLREFAEKQEIPYPLLSDIDSHVIRHYGILNDQIEPGDAFLHGIPYPGVFLCDEEGRVIAKSFHDSYKKRDSPELLIAAALGELPPPSEDEPSASGGSPELRVSARVLGGSGSVRQGIYRHLIVRFEMDEDLHVYGEPVPDGMIPVSIEVEAPPGFVIEDTIVPPTEPLRLESVGVDLNVWSGTVEMQIPFHAVGELASETRPLDSDHIEIAVHVRYQACDDDVCLLPTTETLRLTLPMDVIDIPDIALHAGHGQRAGNYDGTPHLRRLLLRKVKQSPIGFLRFIGRSIRLELAARTRRRRKGASDQ